MTEPWQGSIDPAGVIFALTFINPVVPLMLELSALRRMKSAVFGIMMSMEPAIALLVGVLVLSQSPSLLQVLGIGLVIAATVAAQLRSRRAGRRRDGRRPMSRRAGGSRAQIHPRVAAFRSNRDARGALPRAPAWLGIATGGLGMTPGRGSPGA